MKSERMAKSYADLSATSKMLPSAHVHGFSVSSAAVDALAAL